MYRIHGEPAPDRIAGLRDFLALFGYSLKVPAEGKVSPKVLQQITDWARGRPEENLISSVLLRTMRQAVYSPENLGHFGLAADFYCHFTSPIRRYPDLCVHRALLAAAGEEEHPPPAHELEEIGTHSTATEREAMALERDADDICFAFLLERELARSGWDRRFEGEVSGVISAGAFVSFTGVEGGAPGEGFLPARRIGGDWYDVNELQTALVGRNTGRMIRLADPVDVVVRSVEPERGRIDLEPAARLAAAAT
jgi:ribonuclease R